MKPHLEDDELEILSLVAESYYQIDSSARVVDCLVAKGLLYRTARGTLLLTIRAIDLLDSQQ